MAPFERITTTFTRGELSPRITARVDFEGRFDGVEKLENFLVHVQGGAQKRSGTRFVAATKDEINAVRLLPFRASILANYVIEATNLTFRFYADEGRLENPPGTPVEAVTPYTSADLAQLKWTQSADIMFLAHPSHKPRELRRTSATTFSLTDYDFQDGPYLDRNRTATTFALSGTSGSVTVTASSANGFNDDDGFKQSDVGRLIRWRDPAGNWTWLEITAVTNSLNATATIRGPDASAGTATKAWRLGAWSDTTGWPSVCTFHQSRLWWARTAAQPQTVWSTSSGSIDDFTPSEPDGTVAADHAVTLTINSNQVNAIAWLVSSQRGLQIGTIGEEWLVRSADNTSGITASSVEVIPQGAWGSDDEALPVRVGTSTLYVQHGGTIIRESAFNFDEDVFDAQNITVLSEHMFRKGVQRLTFQQVPVQTAWALLADGTLAGFTFDKEQKVLAWHHHTIADAEVLDIVTMDTSHAGSHHEHLWVVARRTIGGAQRQYVEFMEAPFDAQLNTIEDAFFIDSGLSYSGAPATTITGLTHLEGKTVAVLADGSVQPSKVVSGGAIALDRAAAEVHVGLPFTAEINTMPLEAPQREGSFVTLGKTKRIHQVLVLLAETVGVKIGPLGGKLDEVAFRKPMDAMDQPVPLFDGIKRLTLESRWEETPRIRVVSDQPLPCTVLAQVSESQVHGS